MIAISFIRPGDAPDDLRNIRIMLDIGLSEKALACWMSDILSRAYQRGDSISQSQMAALAEEAIRQLL